MKTAAIISLLLLIVKAGSSAQTLSFSRLPDLPDREGFAGMFAGVSGDALIIAGGANFPDRRPWEGGNKVWRDEIWLLSSPTSGWKIIGKLPLSLAYGVSVTFRNEVVCAGGGNAQGHHGGCFALRLVDGKISRRVLPDLPSPCANHCGALVDGTLFVAGGIDRPEATTALHSFWSLDLEKTDATWKQLKPWPGRERMLAAAGSHDGIFYLFGGAALHADANGKPEREWLKDAFSFEPRRGWVKLPDMPRVVVAAPSPAPADSSGLFILSGDDGSKAGFKPEPEHPGFPRTALRFDPGINRWLDAGTVPFSRATVPTACWHEKFVIPNGEARPGYRTNEVWQLELR